VLGIRVILVRIQTCISDLWIRVRIQLRIRLLSSVTLRMQKKIFFKNRFLYSNLLTGTLSSALKMLFFAKILC